MSSASMPGMKIMMYMMPVMMLFIFNDYASGLSYYYFLSLLITIIQTMVFNRMVDSDKLRAEMQANKAKPVKSLSSNSVWKRLLKPKEHNNAESNGVKS